MYEYSYDELKRRLPLEIWEVLVVPWAKYTDLAAAFDQLTRIAPPGVWTAFVFLDQLKRAINGKWIDSAGILWNTYLNTYISEFKALRPPALLYESTPRGVHGDAAYINRLLRYIYQEFDSRVRFYEELGLPLFLDSVLFFGDWELVNYLSTRPDTLRYRDGVNKKYVKRFAESLYALGVSFGASPWEHGNAVLSMEDKIGVIEYIIESANAPTYPGVPRFLLEHADVRRAWCTKEALHVFDTSYKTTAIWLAVRDPDEDVGTVQNAPDDWLSHSGVVYDFVWESFADLVRSFRDARIAPILLGNALHNFKQAGGDVSAEIQVIRKHLDLSDWMFAVAQHPGYKRAVEVIAPYSSLYQVTSGDAE